MLYLICEKVEYKRRNVIIDCDSIGVNINCQTSPVVSFRSFFFHKKVMKGTPLHISEQRLEIIRYTK